MLYSYQKRDNPKLQQQQKQQQQQHQQQQQESQGDHNMNKE